MSPLRAPLRLALVSSVVVLVLLTVGVAIVGYLLDAANQSRTRAHRLATAATYVRQGTGQLESTLWQQSLTRELSTLGLNAELTLTAPGIKRVVYVSGNLAAAIPSERQPSPGVDTSQQSSPTPNASRSSASYLYALPAGTGTITLDLFAPPPDRTRSVLVAAASAGSLLLIGAILLAWSMNTWLVAPLRRLNAQVDAIAGGDPLEARISSPIREVDNVATAVVGMAARLADTNEHDARLERERRLFVNSIAHDLRTPLFTLRGYLDAIATGIGNPAEQLERAQIKGAQLDRLVTGLFDYVRADIDQQPLLQSTDLAEAVLRATAPLDLIAAERGVELHVTGANGIAVTIDRDGFERALGNILDNALRHTPSGGAVAVTCSAAGHHGVVRVIDSGPGIPPDLFPDLFELPARGTGDRPTDGAGLGLLIAARLIRSQHGAIEAQNASTGGAMLTIRVLRRPDSSTDVDWSPDSAEPIGRPASPLPDVS